MIDIVINARFLSQPLTGVQRYATEIMRQFDAMIDSGRIDGNRYHIVLAIPRDCQPSTSFKHLEVKRIGRVNNNLWEQLSLARYSAGKVLYNPCNTGPILHDRDQVITIHDASVFALPATYTFLFRTKYQILIWLLGRRSAVTFTGSKFSKDELVHHCGLNPEKIRVVYLGHEHILELPCDDQVWKDRFSTSKPYILAVGSHSFHKNSTGVIKALELMPDAPVQLVMIGGVFSKVFRSMSHSENLSVQRLGYVSDANLRSLYSHAVAFIYPSFYEGFGLPPLEAMACGCPVIVSNRASLPEVCGDAAEYCNPEDPSDIFRAIRRVIDDENHRAELIQKGKAQVTKFNWKSAAETIWEEIEKLADTKTARANQQ